MRSTWNELSTEITKAIDEAGKSIVAVDARGGHTSSGILWRPDIVITAAHAVRHGAGIRVILGPESSVTGRLAGKDRGTDIAVLKLEKEAASPAELGSAAPLSVGDLTVAVARTRRGNLVASAGILGGLMGEWQVHRTRIDRFIRPDVTLYPGFSGGALIGAGGKILGMNTSGLLRGTAITIPASTLAGVAEEIVSKGHVAQPYIGLVMQPAEIPDALRQKANVNVATGLVVLHAEPGGPADAAGVMLGDVLLEIDGESFDVLQDVHELLGRKGAGNAVQATLIRGGQKVETTIQVGVRPVS